MRPNSPVNAVVVRKEEKQAKLIAFVTAHLDELRDGAAGESSALAPVLVVARSFDSPVVLALQSLAAELAARGLGILAIVTGEVVSERQSTASAPLDWRTRTLADARFQDAHEQLWLSPSTAWIGDCMRRDPSKRDAYESYADRSETTAGYAATSFWRLWHIAQPMADCHHGRAIQTADGASASCAPDAPCADPAATERDEAASGLTRQ